MILVLVLITSMMFTGVVTFLAFASAFCLGTPFDVDKVVVGSFAVAIIIWIIFGLVYCWYQIQEGNS